MAAPVVRATPVIPAAADCSSGLTTAIVYDCRVGTSIWLMLNRTIRTETASESVGISGTRMSSTFDGRMGHRHRLTMLQEAESLKNGFEQFLRPPMRLFPASPQFNNLAT